MVIIVHGLGPGLRKNATTWLQLVETLGYTGFVASDWEHGEMRVQRELANGSTKGIVLLLPAALTPAHLAPPSWKLIDPAQVSKERTHGANDVLLLGKDELLFLLNG